jgi:type VI secretion system protein ImpA
LPPRQPVYCTRLAESLRLYRDALFSGGHQHREEQLGNDVSNGNQSPEILQFAKLLAPIPGDKPTGANLRSDGTSLFYQTKDARNKARSLERKVIPGEEVKAEDVPDWKPVLQAGVKALSEKTKDLEIAAYLIEALVRLHGFAGLRDGLRLTRELVEKFWDKLYPEPDEEEGLGKRVAPLTGLNGDDSEGTLMDPILRVPLTDNSSVGRFSFLNYHEVQAISKLTDAKEKDKRLQRGAANPDNFAKAFAESPPKFYATTVGDINQCTANLTQLGSVLDKLCGKEKAPPTSAIRESLENCLNIIKEVARDKLAAAAAETPQPAKPPGGDGAPAAAAGAAAPAAKPGEIRTRDDAFKTLAEVAAFFRRTEPHTIVYYALEQVVRWGKMSLPELLTELIPDEGPRKGLFKQVGIPVTGAGKAEPAKK